MQSSSFLRPTKSTICLSEVVHARQRIGMLVTQHAHPHLQHLLMQGGGFLHPTKSTICRSEVVQACQRTRVFWAKQESICFNCPALKVFNVAISAICIQKISHPEQYLGNIFRVEFHNGVQGSNNLRLISPTYLTFVFFKWREGTQE